MGNAKLAIVALVPLFLVVIPALISEQAGGWTKKYTSNPTGFGLKKLPNLSDKVAIVTGGTSGIGYETALNLIMNGATVVLTARTKQKGDETAARIVDFVANADPNATVVRIKPAVLDLSSLASVKKFAAEFKRMRIPLHILVLNAGVMKSPGHQFVGGKNFTYGYELTKDGLESQIGVNHVGHFYLTKLLKKELKLGAPSRVVSVASNSESGGYPEGIRPDTWMPDDSSEDAVVVPEWYEDGAAHSQSKLANILFAREYAKRMEGTGVTAYSVHPGVVRTNLQRYLMEHWGKIPAGMSALERIRDRASHAMFLQACMDPADGALTQLYVASAPEEELENGGYYWPVGKLAKSSHPQGTNETLQELMWNETEKVISVVLAANNAKNKEAKMKETETKEADIPDTNEGEQGTSS